MKEALLLTFGFGVGFSLMAWSRSHVVDRLQRDNALLEKSRNFWFSESLKSPVSEVATIQRTLDAIEKQLVDDSGDCA